MPLAADHQARRENVSSRAARRQIIETIQFMDEDELRELRAAINGEAPVARVSPKRAYAG